MHEQDEQTNIVVEIPTDFQSLINADSNELIAHIMSLDGVGDFNEEFMMWQEYLSKLAPYDDGVVREKLDAIDLEDLMPNTKKVDVYESYYRLVETQKFLYTLHKPVHGRCEMLKDAIKSLRSSARGMFKGTDKDKEAHSDRMVRNFTAEFSRAKALLSSIVGAIDFVEFAATQASRVIKEREFELRVNSGYAGQGQANIFAGFNTQENEDDNPIPPKYRKQCKNPV